MKKLFSLLNIGSGYRSYAVATAYLLNLLLTNMGYVEYGSKEVETMVEVLFGVLWFLFRYLATKGK